MFPLLVGAQEGIQQLTQKAGNDLFKAHGNWQNVFLPRLLAQ